MKKFFKIVGILIIVALLALYAAFLFVLPKVVDINKFKPDIIKTVKEQTNLDLNFENPKITVTPLLAAGISADDITIKLPDDSELLSADNFIGRISLPHLIFLTVKVSKAEILNPVVNIDIINGKAFKAVSAFEEVLNKKDENIEETLQTAQKPLIDPALIKVVIPCVKLINYSAFINDLKTNEFLKLRGDELSLGYYNGKAVSVKTIAELYLNQTKNITANIDINTFIPQQSKLDEEDDKAQRVEIPFVNPVAMYKAYDLKADINSKIKIRQGKKNIYSNGYFNVDDFTLKLSGMQLPKSKFHISTKGTKAFIDSDLYITESETISLLGLLNYSEHPKMDMKIQTNEIYTNDVLNLIKATLDSLHIKHELNPIAGEGYFIANTNIKTDFKKLVSSGNINIKNCIIKNIKTKQKLAKINSTISLDNNMLKFIDTAVEIADTIFKLDGTIDDKSYADINVFMEKMPVNKLFTMFLPAEINNTYNVNSGYINLTAAIKGELKKAQANLKLSVDNLSLTDTVNKITYVNNLLVADFISNFKSFTGKITDTDFKLTMNSTNVNCDRLTVTIGEKDITVDPAQLRINNTTLINIEGFIKDYIKKPEFDFNINGNLIAKDLKQLLGKDLEIFIKDKGKIPLNITLTGDNKKQTLFASIEADKDNFITPIDISSVVNKNTVLQTVIDFKGDRLKIKDTGFYIKTLVQDPKEPEKTITKLDEVVGIDGTITKLNTLNPNINLIKLKMPKELEMSLCAFPQSKLYTKGNMFIFGDLTAPRIRGEFNLRDASIPELLLSIKTAAAKFEGKDLDVNINNINANGSDFNVMLKADLNPSENFVINSLNLISNLTDADKLMKVSDALMKYMPPQPASNTNQPDIPVIIKDGTIDIKQIKTGNIVLNDTTGKISLNKNILYINNLLTSAFKGKIKGDVSMNLVTSEIKALLKGSGLDVEKTLLDAAAMKDTLSGTMDFDTNISLKGSTYEEQMKTLNGKVTFLMKNGTLGPFGKLENLIMAENIRESAFFQSTIGSVLNSLLSFDTSHYNELKGTLLFNNGIADISPITSSGDIMGAHIFGNFNLLTNKIDIKFRGRLGSQVSDSLGPISMINPVNLVKATPGMSLVLGKIFFLFCEAVTLDELNLIPSLGKEISDTNATKFQVIIRGDVAKPLTLVKSFKWLALESEIDNAKAYLNSIPQDVVPKDITVPTKEEIKEQAGKAIKETVENSLSEETKEAIEQHKETASKLKSLFKNKEKLKEEAGKAAKNALNQYIQENTNNNTEITE